MASQSVSLIPVRTPAGRRRVNTFAAMVPDASHLSDMVQRIAATEVNKEIRRGNPPQNFIVDNQDAKPFNQAGFRILTLFADSRVVAQATHALVRELQKRTIVGKTGAAKASYQIWSAKGKRDTGKMEIPNANSASIDQLEALYNTLPAGGDNRLIVVGPLVKYGRVLYWRPKGYEKLAGRARYRIVYNSTTGRLSRINANRIDGERKKKHTNMKDLAVGVMRRRFKGVRILGQWVKGHDTVAGDNSWPGIAVGLRLKGRVRR